MKFIKPILLLVCLTLVMSLTACAPSASKDVLKEAAQKSKDLKNFTANVTGTIKITQNGQPMAMDMDSKMQIQLKPMEAHMNVGMGTNGAKMDMEMYLDGGTAYIKVASMPQWVKANNEAQMSLLKGVHSSDPNELFDMLQKYTDKIDMKETNDGYDLDVSSKNGKINGFLKEYIQKQMPAGQSEEMKNILDKMSIESLNYKTVIDKKTFYPKSVKAYIKATVKDGNGNTVGLEENVTSTYSDFNKTINISVPKEVKDGAIEIPADQLKGI